LGASLTAAIEEARMISLDDLKRTIRRNKLLGMWAAKKLGGADAEAYSDALAVNEGAAPFVRETTRLDSERPKPSGA